MNRFVFLALLGWAGTALAHQVAVRPNEMHVSLEGNALHIEARVPSGFWLEHVFGEPLTPFAAWKDAWTPQAITYWNKRVVFFSDGQPLTPEWISGQYNADVWTPVEQQKLRLHWIYRLPPGIREVSGRITLYIEDYNPRRPHPGAEWSSTFILKGSPTRQIFVPIDKPDFVIPLADLALTPADRQKAEAWQSLQFWKKAPGMVVLVCAVLLGTATWPIQTRALLAVGAITMATIVVGWRHGYGWPGYAGSAVALTGWVLLLCGALRLYQRRLLSHSESRAAILFVSQTRFLGLFAAGLGLYWLWKGH